jgi:6,7-dimethyl-8-ribityllumazine synthase
MLYKVITSLGRGSDVEIQILQNRKVLIVISRWNRRMQRNSHYLSGSRIEVDSVDEAVDVVQALRDEGFEIPFDLDIYEGPLK